MLIGCQCNLHSCSSALNSLAVSLSIFVNVNVISWYVVVQLVNVNVIGLCLANEVGWLVNRSVAGAVGQH
jgi:hypothetical protein